MRKIILIIALFLFLCPCISVYGEETDEIISIDDFDFAEAGQVLNDAGYEELNIKNIINKIITGDFYSVFKSCADMVYQKTVGDVSFIYKILGNLVLVVVLSAFFTNFARVFSKDNVSETAFYICYLVAITLMISLFESFCVITADFISLLTRFMYGIVPTYFLSVAIIGQVTAAGFYQLTLVIITVSEFVFLHIIIPLIKIYVAVSIVNNISREDFLSKTANVIKNLVNFLTKLFVGIVTSLNVIQALVLPSVDSAKNTTIRKFVGTLPVIGEGTDAMTSIMLGSFNLLKNTIGGFAIIVILVLCLIPFFKVQIYSFSIQIAAALVQPISDQRITDSFSCLAVGMKMLARVIISGGMLFVISLAIVCMMTGRS